MSNKEQVIQDLQNLKKKVGTFIQPVTPEVLRAYFNGLERGVFLIKNTFTFDDFTLAKRKATMLQGWEDIAKSPFYEMRDKGLAEDLIVQEMIEIEIKTWQILEESENEK